MTNTERQLFERLLKRDKSLPSQNSIAPFFRKACSELKWEFSDEIPDREIINLFRYIKQDEYRFAAFADWFNRAYITLTTNPE